MPEYMLFWGHTLAKCGQKACLSNWFPAPFVDGSGNRFVHTEQYMMWRKAVLFEDHEIAEEILKTTRAGTCKSLGRKVRNFDQKVWEENAQEIVFDGCLLKFQQNQEMRYFLEASKGKKIVEASPVDSIWGIGLAESHPDSRNESKWRGKNWLGIVLMRVRDVLLRENEISKNCLSSEEKETSKQGVEMDSSKQVSEGESSKQDIEQEPTKQIMQEEPPK